MLGPSIENLKSQAEPVARLAGRQDDIWSDPKQVDALLAQLGAGNVEVTLLDRTGQLIASSPVTGVLHASDLAQDLDVAAVLGGERSSQVLVTSATSASHVRIVTPVLSADERLLGVLLVSHEVATAQDVLGQTIRLLALAVAVLLIAAVGAGTWLALRLNRSLQQATAALHDVATGQRLEALPDQRIREIDDLYQAVNGLVERLRSLETARRRLLANLVHELGRPWARCTRPSMRCARGPTKTLRCAVSCWPAWMPRSTAWCRCSRT